MHKFEIFIIILIIINLSALIVQGCGIQGKVGDISKRNDELIFKLTITGCDCPNCLSDLSQWNHKIGDTIVVALSPYKSIGECVEIKGGFDPGNYGVWIDFFANSVETIACPSSPPPQTRCTPGPIGSPQCSGNAVKQLYQDASCNQYWRTVEDCNQYIPSRCCQNGGCAKCGAQETYRCVYNVVQRLVINGGAEQWEVFDDCNKYNPPRECLGGVCIEVDDGSQPPQPKECDKQSCKAQSQPIGVPYNINNVPYIKYKKCDCNTETGCNCISVETQEIKFEGTIEKASDIVSGAKYYTINLHKLIEGPAWSGKLDVYTINIFAEYPKWGHEDKDITEGDKVEVYGRCVIPSQDTHSVTLNGREEYYLKKKTLPPSEYKIRIVPECSYLAGNDLNKKEAPWRFSITDYPQQGPAVYSLPQMITADVCYEHNFGSPIVTGGHKGFKATLEVWNGDYKPEVCEREENQAKPDRYCFGGCAGTSNGKELQVELPSNAKTGWYDANIRLYYSIDYPKNWQLADEKTIQKAFLVQKASEEPPKEDCQDIKFQGEVIETGSNGFDPLCHGFHTWVDYPYYDIKIKSVLSGPQPKDDTVHLQVGPYWKSDSDCSIDPKGSYDKDIVKGDTVEVLGCHLQDTSSVSISEKDYYYIKKMTAKPDLVVSSLRFGKNPCKPGEDVEISFDVTNQGNADADPCIDCLKIDGTNVADFNSAGLTSGSKLKPGESRSWTYIYKSVPASSSGYSIEGCADCKTQISESDEDNNCRADTIAVSDSGIVDYWAILIGSPDDDTTGTEDAISIYNALLASSNWKKDHIDLLIKGDVSREKIKQSIDEHFGKADKDDICLFFYSGHGALKSEPNDPRGYSGMIDPTASSAVIHSSELEEWLSKINTKNMIVILNSCHSGAFLGKGRTPDGRDYQLDKNGYVVITACKADEISSAHHPEFGKYGLMSFYLLLGLWGSADSNQDCKISIEELFNFMQSRVSENDQVKDKPTPQISDNHDGELIINEPFSGLQKLICDATPGDTLKINPGVYKGPIIINKPLTVIGNGAIIDSDGRLGNIYIHSDNVDLSGFTLKKGDFGIYLDNCKNNAIHNNVVQDSTIGVYIYLSNFNKLVDLDLSYIKNIRSIQCFGVYMLRSDNNILDKANIYDYFNSIEIYNSNLNEISRIKTEGDVGSISLLQESNNNKLFCNHIKDIKLMESRYNYVYRNSFDCSLAKSINGANPNYWDKGYSEGGNYWNDYAGVDINGDGFGDTPYIITEDAKDNYPLMTPRNC